MHRALADLSPSPSPPRPSHRSLRQVARGAQLLLLDSLLGVRHLSRRAAPSQLSLTLPLARSPLANWGLPLAAITDLTSKDAKFISGPMTLALMSYSCVPPLAALAARSGLRPHKLTSLSVSLLAGSSSCASVRLGLPASRLQRGLELTLCAPCSLARSASECASRSCRSRGRSTDSSLSLFPTQYLLFACVRLSHLVLLATKCESLTFCLTSLQHATNATTQGLQGARFLQCASRLALLPSLESLQC